jgi:hypothetical protein
MDPNAQQLAIEKALGPLKDAASTQPLFYLLSICLVALVVAVLVFISRTLREFMSHLKSRDEKDEQSLKTINGMAVACHAHSREMIGVAHDAAKEASQAAIKSAEAAVSCATALRDIARNGNNGAH